MIDITPVRLIGSLRRQWESFARQLAPYALFITLIVIGVPFIYLMFYAVPASDDFCKASLSFNGEKQHTLYAFVRLYYWGWSPRWATSFLQGLSMNTATLLEKYPVMLLMVVVTQIAALTYFFSVILKLTYRRSATAACLFYLVWLCALEKPAENVYWYTGASEYMISITSMLLVAGLLCSRQSLWKGISACTLSFLIPAQHEMAGAFLCAFLLVGAIVARVSRHQTRTWIFCLAAAALSLAVVIGSPGGHLRAAQEGRHLWNIHGTGVYVKFAIAKGVEWLPNTAALLAAGYIFLFWKPLQTDEGTTWCPRSVWALLCGSGMVLVILEFFAVELAGGSTLPDRTVGWFHFIFWLFLFLLIIGGQQTLDKLGRSADLQLCVVALLFLALASGNFRYALEDLIGPAASWRHANAQRLVTRDGDVRWMRLPQKPKLLMDSEVSTDPSWWENRCEANYLNVDSVAISDSK